MPTDDPLHRISLPRRLRAAITFLTCVPLPSYADSDEEAARVLRSALVWFPFVGGLIGLTTGLLIVAASCVWSAPIAVLIGLLIESWFTGAFHEDAVADTCDAFGGGWTREDILRILKDSRIGTFGTVGLGLALGLRWACLCALSGETLIVVSTASAAWGRCTIVLLMRLLPAVENRGGLAKDVSGAGVTTGEVLQAFLITAPFLALVFSSTDGRCLLGIPATILFVSRFASYLWRRIGGTTGDCLGFSCYVGQLSVLLAATAQLR